MPLSAERLIRLVLLLPFIGRSIPKQFTDTTDFDKRAVFYAHSPSWKDILQHFLQNETGHVRFCYTLYHFLHFAKSVGVP